MDVVLNCDIGGALPVVSRVFVLYFEAPFSLFIASTSRIIHLGSWKRLQVEDWLMLFITVSNPPEGIP